MEPVVPHQLKSRIEAAEAGLATPLLARAIRVIANITSKSHAAVSVEVSIEPKDLVSGEIGSLRLSGLLDVIYALYDENHVRIKAGQRNEIKLNINRDRIVSFLERPYKQVNTLTVPADACSLRVLIRDADSGAMGSASVTLDCHG